jgi:hypothetical protein
MARRERRAEDEGERPAEPAAVVEGGIEGESAGAEDGGRRRDGRAAKKGDEVGRTKMTLSLADEWAWRLRVLAEMQRTTPGRLIEPLIVPYLKQQPLPYEKYRRKGPGTGTGPEEVSAA